MRKRFEMETVTPEAVGVDPRDILAFLDRIEEKKIHLHSFLMLKGDRIFAGGSYAPCQKEDVHMLFSMSKSFTSTAVGFAVQEGRIALSDRVVNFFAEELAGYAGEVNPHMKEVRIRHLLTMNTGQTDPEDGLFTDWKKDWCLSFLTSLVEKEPGSWFLYNTRATYMLSAIVEKVTGESLIEYLRPRLFEPLGFSENIWWETSPQGICAGGFGLNISVEDLAKFGIFVKNGGVYDGKRLLGAEWFAEATKSQSDSSNTWAGENAYGYGYQFWMCHIPGVYRGDGAFGQYCVIMPEEDMLFVTTAGELDMQRILDAFWDTVYKKQRSVKGEKACPAKEEKRPSAACEGWQQGTHISEDMGAQRPGNALEERLKNLTLPAYYEEKGIEAKKIELPEEMFGKEYVLEENALHITALRFLWADGETDGCLLEIVNGKNRDTLTVSAVEWMPGRLHLDGSLTELHKSVFREGLYENCHVKGCMRGYIFYLDMLFAETSYQDTWEIVCMEKEILLTVRRNTGFVPVDVCVKGIAA